MRALFKLVYAFMVLSVSPVWAQLEATVENGATVPASDGLSRSVALVKLGGGTCSASFLTRKILLTAGHCTTGARASSTSVSVRDSSGRWVSAGASQLITHPQYKIQQTSGRGTMVQNDVGLILLAQDFPLAIRPLKISSASGLKGRTADVTVAGYGLGSQGGSSGVLRRGTMTATVEAVDNFFGRSGLYMEEKAGQIICAGDSGGAVLNGGGSSTSLIGVNSLSSGCKGGVGSSMAELTSQHKSWIRRYGPDVP